MYRFLKSKTNEKLKIFVQHPGGGGGEGHRRKFSIEVVSVLTSRNFGTSCHGNGIIAAMFLPSPFYTEQFLQ